MWPKSFLGGTDLTSDLGWDNTQLQTNELWTLKKISGLNYRQFGDRFKSFQRPLRPTFHILLVLQLRIPFPSHVQRFPGDLTRGSIVTIYPIGFFCPQFCRAYPRYEWWDLWEGGWKGMNGSLDLYPPKQLQSLQTGRLISAIGLFCCFVRGASDGRTGGNLGEGLILYF